MAGPATSATAQQPPAHAPAAAAPQTTDFDGGHADTDAADGGQLLGNLHLVPVVQRACAACGGSDDDGAVRPMRVQRKCESCEAELPVQPRRVQRKCAACAAKDEHQTPVQPRLEVGPVDDPFEREADTIADRVMAMRTVPQPAATADAAVQRRPITASPARLQRMAQLPPGFELDTADTPRMKAEAAQAEAGRAAGESIAASAAQLTSGGMPLGAATRAFFEARMGRDLSDVRVHEGGASDDLNQSISARAFTYRNHIWLSRSERAAPTFTMAHELAHVLQQTRPGAAQAHARREDAGPVRRMFWQPAKTDPEWIKGEGARSRHSKYHTQMQEAIHRENKQITGEIRMPNATASEVADGKLGFADLYESDNNNVPGLRVDKSGDLVNLVYQKGLGSWGFHPVIPNPKYHYSHRYPRIKANGTIHRCGDAPSEFTIGDVKPGHNSGARAEGTSQIQKYFSGIQMAVDATNTAAGSTCWNVKPDAYKFMTRIPKIPAEMDPSNNWKRGFRFRSIELKDGKKIYTPNSRVRGRLTMAKDTKNAGIWVYFLQPSLVDLARAVDIGGIKEDKDLDRAAKRLDKVLKCLRTNPARPAKVCKRPAAPGKVSRRPAPRRRIGALSAGSAKARSGPVVRRKKAGKAKDDSFDLKVWNALRVGSKNPKYAAQNKRSLKQSLKKDLSEGLKGKIGFRRAVLQSKDHLSSQFEAEPKLPGGLTKGLQGKIETQGRLIEKLEFWTSGKAGALGRARKIFGTAFVRVMTAVENFRRKFRRLAGKARPKHSYRKAVEVAAINAMVKVIVGMTGGIMRRVIATVLGCVEQSFDALMVKITEGSGLSDLQAQAEQAETYVQQLGEDIFADIETRIDEAIAPIAKQLDELGQVASLIGKVVGIAMQIVQGMRIGTCLAGLSAAGVGAIVTCLAAAGDFVLSLFGLSPIDWLASKIIASCANRQLMAEGMLKFDAIRTLPTRVSQEIVKALKARAPAPLDQMFCDPATVKSDPLTMADFTCADPYGFGWGDGGTGTWRDAAADISPDAKTGGTADEGGGTATAHGPAGSAADGTAQSGTAQSGDGEGKKAKAGSGKGGSGKPAPKPGDAQTGKGAAKEDTKDPAKAGGQAASGGDTKGSAADAGKAKGAGTRQQAGDKDNGVEGTTRSNDRPENMGSASSSGHIYLDRPPTTYKAGDEISVSLVMTIRSETSTFSLEADNVPAVFVGTDTEGGERVVTFYIRPPEGDTRYGLRTKETNRLVRLAAGEMNPRTYPYKGRTGQ